MSEFAPAVNPADLDTCAREPIHVPGAIQPFGVMLITKVGSTMISQASVNTSSIFGIEPPDVLGVDLDRVFGTDNAARIVQGLEGTNWKEVNPLKLTVDAAGTFVPVNVIIHRHDGLNFIEIEKIVPEGEDAALRSYQMIQAALLRLQRSLNIPDLWSTVVAEVQRVTGYDRVMVYKFDRDEHGSVIAEQKRKDQPSLLGLHYPASDIPEQARRLYRENWVRYIPDSHYVPANLIPVVDQDHDRLTDMTHCVLRSVSPLHCEYLHNMGVAASMSVSILRNGRLWGLIACHNDSPRYLPYEMRAACEVLGQVLSIRIAALEESEDCAYKAKTNELQARFLAELPNSPDLASALVGPTPNLLDFIYCGGAVVTFGDKLLTIGAVPPASHIQRVVDSILKRALSPVFATDRLQDRLKGAEQFAETSSGVLCFTVSKAHNVHVLWFRPEQVQVVHWSGDPNKPVTLDSGVSRLSPRKSFELWKQEVRGKSHPWTQPEIEAAAELRATLMSLLLNKTKDGKFGLL